MGAEQFAKYGDLDDPKDRRVYGVLLREANLMLNVMPEMNALNREMYAILEGTEVIDQGE